jgi:ABC-type multidrug transport system fused ATPase/permease subunit
VDVETVFKGSFIPFFAFMGVGAAAANIPSIENAKNKAQPIFNFIDETSTLDARKISEDRISTLGEGHIQFKDTLFAYPSKKKPVLDHLNLDIPASSKIALIGHSGCGKSTITNLLLRFYNTQGGSILIDDHDIAEYNVHQLRKQMGYVMQEPILFNRSIKDNIKYGNFDATDEQVYKAALIANAVEFIESTSYEALTK